MKKNPSRFVRYFEGVFFLFRLEIYKQKIKFVIKELNKLILFFALFVIYVQRNYVISDFVSIKLMHNKLV